MAQTKAPVIKKQIPDISKETVVSDFALLSFKTGIFIKLVLQPIVYGLSYCVEEPLENRINEITTGTIPTQPRILLNSITDVASVKWIKPYETASATPVMIKETNNTLKMIRITFPLL